jgi:hypothetical protein
MTEGNQIAEEINKTIKPEEKADFVICTNAESDVSIPSISSIMNLFGKGYRFIWDIRGAGGYARTRNVLATAFLKNNKADMMMCLDRDMVFNKEYIDFLIEDFKAGHDLVGGLYSVRDGTHLTTFGLDKGNITIDGTIQEVKWLSTGFGYISRRLLQKMVDELPCRYTTPDGEVHDRIGLPLMNVGSSLESYPFFEDHLGMDGDSYLWLSEDYDFCNKARAMGIKPMADTRIWVGHIGSRMYEVPDVLAYQKKMMEEMEAKKKEKDAANTNQTTVVDAPTEVPTQGA